jgi:hypothetical protein
VHSTSENGLSEAQTQLARRATTLCIACERLEGVAASGAEIDIALYGEIVDRLGRCLSRLGLKRQAREIIDPLIYAAEHADEDH